MLEHDVLDFTADDAHETGDVRAAVCFAEVLLPGEGPGVFGLGEEGGVGLGGEALGEEGFLVFVGLAGGCGCVVRLVWRVVEVGEIGADLLGLWVIGRAPQHLRLRLLHLHQTHLRPRRQHLRPRPS